MQISHCELNLFYFYFFDTLTGTLALVSWKAMSNLNAADKRSAGKNFEFGMLNKYYCWIYILKFNKKILIKK